MVSGVFSLPLLVPQGPPQTFLADDENALVRVAQRVVLQGRREQLPLVIYGSSGTGKSLLADGLAESWREAAAGREVFRTSGVDFARAYADACDTDSIGDFRDLAAKAGLVLVDAVHPLIAKDRAVREFCYQLDHWLHNGKVVIVTCLVSPLDLKNAALASRLSAGLVIPLRLPSPQVRRELLGHFARQRSLELDDELLDQLAKRVRGTTTNTPSARDLHAALVQLETKARLTGCEVDRRLVESLFEAAVDAGQVEFQQIVAVVAKRFGVGIDELRSSSRRQSLVRARGVAVVLGRRLTAKSLQALGEQLGDRDHSTIHHALETTTEAIANDESLRQLVAALELELAAGPKTKRRSRKAASRG